MVRKKSQEGFVLVTALLILVVLTLLGLATILTSTVELKIAGNDRLHKKTFYQADGGTETGTVLAYENALCINAGGFAAGTTPALADIGFIRVSNLDFADPGQGTTDLPEDPAGAIPAVRDAVHYSTMGDDNSPHTNFTINGIAEYAEGSGLQMDSGYPGLGQGSAGGGTHLRYTINSQRIGELSSRSVVTLRWRMSTHLINSASLFDCKY
jgi:hypothetical protein